jgi:hypothetical protein
MKINPDSVRPDDPGAKRPPALIPFVTVVTVVGTTAYQVDPANTFTERVLTFLDHHAA